MLLCCFGNLCLHSKRTCVCDSGGCCSCFVAPLVSRSFFFVSRSCFAIMLFFFLFFAFFIFHFKSSFATSFLHFSFFHFSFFFQESSFVIFSILHFLHFVHFPFCFVVHSCGKFATSLSRFSSSFFHFSFFRFFFHLSFFPFSCFSFSSFFHMLMMFLFFIRCWKSNKRHENERFFLDSFFLFLF